MSPVVDWCGQSLAYSIAFSELRCGRDWGNKPCKAHFYQLNLLTFKIVKVYRYCNSHFTGVQISEKIPVKGHAFRIIMLVLMYTITHTLIKSGALNT